MWADYNKEGVRGKSEFGGRGGKGEPLKWEKSEDET